MGRFEGVKKAYEDVKKTAQEKWAAFKEKFNGSKEKAVKEISAAQDSESYIAALKKALAEAEGLQSEEKDAEEAETELKDIEKGDEVYDEAVEINKQMNAGLEVIDEAKNEDAARTAAKEKLEQDAMIDQQNSEAKAAELLEKLKGKNTETAVENEESVAAANVEQKADEIPAAGNAEQSEPMINERDQKAVENFPPEIQKYIDAMPVESTMYTGNYLSKIPQELMDNDKFLLKVAETNPASVYSHCSDRLKHDKQFIKKLIEAQPRPDTDKVNFNGVDFYEIEREAPELLYDKDLAMALIKRQGRLEGRFGSMRSEMLKDKDIYEAVVEESIKGLVKEANEVAEEKSGRFARIPDFKLRDGYTIGGDRFSMKNDKDFMEKVKNSVSDIVDVSIDDRGNMRFEPKK